MSTVTIEEVSKSFGHLNILDKVSLKIEAGEFMVLVGPSGCGKSTLLRMVAGLEDVTSGEISLGDRLINKLPPRERDIAMVFQNYALYPHLTVEDNMSFALKLSGESKERRRAAAQRSAEILNLEKQLTRYPRELSGGQRQRVAMGRAIVRNPKLFLFDEPLSNLDAKLRVQMRAEIKELHQRLRTTSIYVTHDQIEAMTMADRIVVMNKGNIEQVGTPMELYDRPMNTFVGGFIGSPSMNFLQVTYRNGELMSPNGIAFPCNEKTLLKEGQSAIYGMRPEHMHISDTGIPVKVLSIEPTGPETHVHVEVAPGVAWNVAQRGFMQAQPGQTVHIVPEVSRVHLFDSETGVRIND